MQHTNRLAGETSPYLLQHAHNPVDWYPWSDEALQRAKREDKPILVSIGYAACHWCHVMERESFENEDTARYMNEHFINIKIDREERPDLDHIYMDAVQAIAGSGGWPLNVFLTPEGRPFYGGTYFPPTPLHNRSSWTEVLAAIADSFRERRDQIEEQAKQLTQHVAGANSFGIGARPGEDAKSGTEYSGIFNTATLRQIYEQLLGTADREEGGFGGAPKFPQTFSIQYLLHYYHFTGEEPALRQACLSLDKMIAGGIYDQIGGGFARYSTDREWLAPHFEKMLYDNALLVIVLSEAYQLTKKDIYREVIEQTIEFVQRELSDAQGGFYAALDADSEGEEGKYYVWDKAEIEAALGEEAELFCLRYGVTAKGNWEGKNILIRAGEFPENEKARLAGSRERLLEFRYRRVRPALDDKILLGWNALMNIACSKAFGALGVEKYRQLAIANMDSCWERMRGKNLYFFFHSYKSKEAKFPAFLDDYAAVTGALLQLQEITGDSSYLLKAKEIMEFVLENFSEDETGFFYFTHRDQQDLILRKKEIYDGAVPSGNSQMAFNLSYMSIIFNKPLWRDRAMQMASALHRPVINYPGSFGIWATLYQAITYIVPEIVLTAYRPEDTRKELLEQMIPYRVFQSAQEENNYFPLLSNKPVEDAPQIFLCKNYSCQLPVNEVNTLIRQLENVQKFSG